MYNTGYTSFSVLQGAAAEKTTLEVSHVFQNYTLGVHTRTHIMTLGKSPITGNLVLRSMFKVPALKENIF